MAIEKEVVRFGPYAGFIANGVRVGNVIHLSGQVGMDAQGQVVGVDDTAAQVRQAYANIAETLEKFGATMANIVDETFFVTDVAGIMADAKAVFGARIEAYGGEPEVTQTMVEVAALVMPELRVEIKCVAYV
ncbi:MAG: RidA family protein [Deltaproteobacteria bacterium]|nr:RidA family protein [Deltaproteobacteria bacterium]MBW2446550.1 RidA family protein [Deltaproteobacteria bacterium]